MVALLEDDDPLGTPALSHRRDVPQALVILGWVLGDVRLERDPRAFEEDHLSGPVVALGVAIVGVVEAREVLRDADGVAAERDVFQDARVPDALLALAVRPVVIEIRELADQRALAHARSAHDRHAHVVATPG
jgi:hypothetical protein